MRLAAGKLAKSIKRMTRRGAPGKALVTVSAAAPYAHLIEFGTAPPVIKPKGGGAMWFGGRPVEIVHHPGAAARPFWRPALDEKYLAAIAAFKKWLAVYIKKQGGK